MNMRVAESRSGVMQWLSAAVVAVLIGRLFQIQVLNGVRLAAAHERQSVRRVLLPAPRGRILDRRGRVLAEDRWVPYLCVIPCEVRPRFESREATVQRLLDSIEVLRDLLPAGQWDVLPSRETLTTHLDRTPELPLWLFGPVADELRARAEHAAGDMPGVAIRCVPRRCYADPELAPHVLGYVREGATGADSRRGRWYREPRHGVRGLERCFDARLRGRPGYSETAIDALGFPIGPAIVREPVPGADVVVSLDADVQMGARRALAGVRGAVVVLEPMSGRILAAASAPSFSLDDISRHLPQLLADSEGMPLLNRAFGGEYAPGSIFKTVLVLGALSDGAIQPSDEFHCRGYCHVGRRRIRCWLSGGHGTVMPEGLLTGSCNCAAIETALRYGAVRFLGFARVAGFGQCPGSDLISEERAGVCLTPGQWVEGAYQAGDLANLAMGQGQLTVTPVQMAAFCAAVANDGMLLPPRFTVAEDEPVTGRALPVTADALQTVRLGMLGVIEGWEGTARRARVPGIPMGGKTGTAQVETRDGERKTTWMILFAPFSRPRYAVAMVVEDGASGGRTVAPRLGAFMRAVFAREGGDDLVVSAYTGDTDRAAADR